VSNEQTEHQEIELPQWEIEALATLVSKRVEDKLFARFGKWVILNLIGLGVVAGGASVAFFDLRTEVRRQDVVNEYQNRIQADIATRLDKILDRLDRMSEQLSTHSGMSSNGGGSRR
jgi:hypothetical protein